MVLTSIKSRLELKTKWKKKPVQVLEAMGIPTHGKCLVENTFLGLNTEKEVNSMVSLSSLTMEVDRLSLEEMVVMVHSHITYQWVQN